MAVALQASHCPTCYAQGRSHGPSKTRGAVSRGACKAETATSFQQPPLQARRQGASRLQTKVPWERPIWLPQPAGKGPHSFLFLKDPWILPEFNQGKKGPAASGQAHLG